MSSFVKKFGQLKQWTSEKLGTAQKTEMPSEISQMIIEADTKRDCIESLISHLQAFIRSHDSFFKGGLMNTGYSSANAVTYQLSKTFTLYGKLNGDESPLGAALVKMGDVFEEISMYQTEFVASIKSGLINDITRLTEKYKDYDKTFKKLENRRLDFDAKKCRLLSKKQKSEEINNNLQTLEDEVKECEDKYQQTLVNLKDLLYNIKQDEVHSLYINIRN